MIEFGFYDSEDQDWHVIPAAALEQEICLVYMEQDPCKEGLHPTGLPEKQDTVLCGPVCSWRRRQAPVAGGINTTGVPTCEQSAGLTRALQLSLDLELNALCVKIHKCSPSAASSASHSCSALAVQFIPPVWLRSSPCQSGCWAFCVVIICFVWL